MIRLTTMTLLSTLFAVGFSSSSLAQAPHPQQSQFVKDLVSRSPSFGDITRGRTGVARNQPFVTGSVGNTGNRVVFRPYSLNRGCRRRRFVRRWYDDWGYYNGWGGGYDPVLARREIELERERIAAAQQIRLQELARQRELAEQKRAQKRQTRLALAEARARTNQAKRDLNRRKIERLNSRALGAEERADRLLVQAKESESRGTTAHATALYKTIVKNYAGSVQAALAEDALERLGAI